MGKKRLSDQRKRRILHAEVLLKKLEGELAQAVNRVPHEDGRIDSAIREASMKKKKKRFAGVD